MTANPGQKWSSSVRIINPNPYDLQVYIEAVNFAPQGEAGQGRFLPVLEGNNVGQSLAGWFELSSEQVLIPAEKTIELPFTISVPENVQPGGHFAALLVGTKPPADSENVTKVETSQIVTSLLFLRVSGDVVESGSIRSFRTEEAVLNRPQATFELRFENTGNVHVQPQGEITIQNMWGQKRGAISINRETMFGNVLPDSVRKFDFTWTGEWSLADIGRYTAVATLAYGTENRQFASSQTSFWVIPWKILSVVGLSLLGFVLFMTWAIRLYVRKMLAMAGVGPGMPQPQPIQATGGNAKVRRVSMVSPIGAGILDLRNRFSESNTWSGRLRTTAAFIKKYSVFFAAVAVLLLFVAVVIWYVTAASVDERGYEVTVEGVGGDVTITSEQVAYQEQKEAAQATTTPEAVQKAVPAMKLINQSGINGLAAALRLELEKKGYTIESLGTDFGANENNTVIVYDPEYAEEALALSRDIPGSLLSAFSETTNENVPIIVYVGRDYENVVQ